MFPPLPEDPFIDRAWRHQRATFLVPEGREAGHPRDDDCSRETLRLYHELAVADESRRAALLRTTPPGEAHAFYPGRGRRLRQGRPCPRGDPLRRSRRAAPRPLHGEGVAVGSKRLV